MPKFFHPDPTVKRQSGILRPVLNESDALGSSLTVPYFHVLSEDSDITSTPTYLIVALQWFRTSIEKLEKTQILLQILDM